MKLFQRLLLAPAVLGLMAPVAASAAELNINDVDNYAPKSSKRTQRVTTRTQFSDVVPGDWAYTALTNLSETYGCLDSTYSRNLQSGQALTRYEAAALVNACLDGGIADGTEGLNSEVIRLSNEFGAEMAILKGRVDGLESRINEISAGQFSGTTSMKGKVAFVVGAVNYEDNAPAAIVEGGEAVAMTYSFRADLNTSFTGKDRLYTRLITGNMGDNAAGTRDNPWADKDGGTYLAVANSNDEIMKIDKLWYEFPVGDFKAYVGPLIENYYMLGQAPSIYKPILKQFALGGNTAAYASSTNGGVGLVWTQPDKTRGQNRWSAATSYVSGTAADAAGGLFTDTNSKWLNQVAYGGSKWGVSLAYALHQCANNPNASGDSPCKGWSDYYSTQDGDNVGSDGEDAYSFRTYWRPSQKGIVPQIQFGLDGRSLWEQDGTGETSGTFAWMTGLTWPKALGSQRIGVAFGQRERATGKINAHPHRENHVDNANGFVWEAYYEYKVNDHTSITPTLFGGTEVFNGTNDDIFGGLIQTVFKF